MALAFQAPSLSRYHRHFQEPQQLLHEMKAGSESLGQGQIPPVRAGRWPATASLTGLYKSPWDNLEMRQCLVSTDRGSQQLLCKSDI